jgi:hypothetical protein
MFYIWVFEQQIFNRKVNWEWYSIDYNQSIGIGRSEFNTVDIEGAVSMPFIVFRLV